MPNHKKSDEEVEDIAKTFYEAEPGHNWNEASEVVREQWRSKIRELEDIVQPPIQGCLPDETLH